MKKTIENKLAKLEAKYRELAMTDLDAQVEKRMAIFKTELKDSILKSNIQEMNELYSEISALRNILSDINGILKTSEEPKEQAIVAPVTVELNADEMKEKKVETIVETYLR